MIEYHSTENQEGMGSNPYPRTRGGATDKAPLAVSDYSARLNACQGFWLFRRVMCLVGFLILGVALAACATPASPAAPAPTETLPPAPAPSFIQEDVSHAAALALMKGHLHSSVALWKAGEYDLAATHAKHPVDELFSIVSDELAVQNAAAPLRSALDEYGAQVDQAGDADNVEAAYHTAGDAIDAAEQTLAGEWQAEPAFQGEVIRALLESVDEEYTEAVRDGQIAEPVEYQDAYGFLAVARERYATLAATVEAAYPRGHEEIEHEFAELEAAFPSVMPPAQAVDPLEVETATREIAAELGEALGLNERAAQTPAESVAQIRETVAHALGAYAEGETDEAYEVAISAYLDGFEALEDDLLQMDEDDLVATLERQFKDLRDGIQAGEPLEDLQALAGEINANLDEVETRLKQ